ncbi:hypothetical protein F3Y22_tig00111693pilonHSYRG00051 [Hibiscus syriacus]|uniref:Uncharacterized protein n=1 Tax=Hibiscus syriacus TaxID=106335 RepID=A0A6A2YIC9_HIBSY|nr:hypothetical protein F3Y22_tig00111693pilonHSYRG00051 [Hibiscus syriacus]
MSGCPPGKAKEGLVTGVGWNKRRACEDDDRERECRCGRHGVAGWNSSHQGLQVR